ncbi:Cyclic di-GMP phosphodiesterase response regulator RpfG [Pirellulimonas nuda]|uniref:Cyclic di-GMP phosphodiesterase response regulator RpfG n=2 Tax=Pirellulimonas nuda TaxID=2528009 RepID=A0A518DCI4_9BACT|nr:Cyclic di-GMP phosphodiesterase response regulator RpfG [Pirellulimonas nuda]
MTATAAAPRNDHDERVRRDYRCVPLDIVRLYHDLGVCLYTKAEDQDFPRLYRSSRIAITDDDVNELRRRGHRWFYVPVSEYAALDQEVKRTLRDKLCDQSVAPEERFAVLQTAAAVELDSAFHMIKCERFVDLSRSIAKDINALFGDDAIAPRRLFDLVQHDFYTFTHATNVAGFATLLADGVGLSDSASREQIALGALLHDIGKRFIPARVLNKSGKLSDEEWGQIRMHPQRGYEDLCEGAGLSEGQLMMVYSHHERIDGQGYPVGMVGDEIHPWAKLLAVVDVFDAITGARPYRAPMKIGQALAFLERNAGAHLDPDMVQCWIALMNKT